MNSAFNPFDQRIPEKVYEEKPFKPALVSEAMGRDKPATALYDLYDKGLLQWDEAVKAWRHVYGADANLQDAIEGEEKQ